MTDTARLQEDVTEIKADIKQQIKEVSALNQHMKDLNGKVKKHEKFVNESCPQARGEIEEQLNAIKRHYYKVVGVFATIMFIITAIVSVFSQELSKKIFGG